jgi:TonB family protein
LTTTRRRLVLAAAFSLAVHLPLVYVGAATLMTSEAGEGDERYFEVLPFVRDAADDPRDPTEEQEREDEEYRPPDDQPDGQVVDAAEAGEARRPDEAAFLSDRDQVVEAQSRARWRTRGEAAPSSRPFVPPSLGEDRPDPQEREDERLLAGLLLRDQARLPTTPDGDHAPNRAPPPLAPSPVNLNPSLAAMSDAVGGTGLDDLGDIEEGDRNLLTTARWLHAPFFERVKRQVEQYWHPDVAFRRFDPEGHVYGYRDRETVVRVVLDASGSLERAYVIRQSGAVFLDDEALSAIEQAAPFPNPPRGLVDPSTNRIVFTFGFTVELGERPIFRLRRYR